MGAENGPGMFSQLQAQVENYNQQNAEQGGKAKLQVYESPTDDCSSDDLEPPPPKSIKLKKSKQITHPMVLAICTPLMARAHQNIQQAGEMVFIDASSLDCFNTAVRIISTSTPTSGIPLGVIMT